VPNPVYVDLANEIVSETRSNAAKAEFHALSFDAVIVSPEAQFGGSGMAVAPILTDI
jgi:hypothetical protein